MARRRRSRSGTSIKRAWDLRRIGRAIAAQGLDLRHWVSYGTVASVGADGGPNYGDPQAILVTPAGVEVDVILEPSNYPVTCKWGMQAGAVYICTPINPGDQVVVILPDGDVSMVPVISCITSGSSDPIPVGTDGKPLFKNDRALIFGRGVPIELRTDGGNQLLVNPDGTIQIGGDDAGEQLMLGTTYRTQQSTLDKALVTAMGTAATACHNATNPATTTAAVQALAVMLDSFVAAYNVFEGQAGAYLSPKNKTK